MKMRGSISMRLQYCQYVNGLISLAAVSFLLTFILTGCASPPIRPAEYGGIVKGKDVFNDIAYKIITSKKRTVAIIDFPDKDGQMIKEGENVAKNMGVILKQKIGIDNVWVESGKSFMNILEKNRIIENGKIANKELAKRLWQNMGIEAVITGVLDPHINGIGFSIELYDVQNDKVIQQYKGIWPKGDAIAAKGSQSPQSTDISRGPWTPPIPSDYQEISQHFLSSYKHATLEDVGKALQTALENAGFKTTYLPVPEGFALVSNDVGFQFSFDGVPALPNTTKAINLLKLLEDLGRHPFKTFFKGWILGTPEHYRGVVCVIVTSGKVWEQGQMTFEEAQNLITLGRTTIPDALKNQEYNEEKHKCMALLYAFEEDPSGDGIRFIPLGDNRIHIRNKSLQKTGFFDNP
ncbi:MAG: hypothetical protein D3908_02345 [Candidatus Electrothrix sp. AUS4]|nr:hypothetical protein [Candidatus Electrothrix sp. AUS4]